MNAKVLLVFMVAFGGWSFAPAQQPKPDRTGMVLIKGGTFIMGLDSIMLKRNMTRFNTNAAAFSQEYPSVRVIVASYYIDQYEVTNAQYKRFVEANPQWQKINMLDSLHNGNYLKDWEGNNYPKGKAKFPVVNVSWFAAQAYAKWVGKRLPMEAEWEYAAKGGQVMLDFPWGKDNASNTRANYKAGGTGDVEKVGSYEPNAIGVYDMAGNAAEFCLDRWRTNKYAQMNDKLTSSWPDTPQDENKVVIKGGSWQSPALELRTTHRKPMSYTECNAAVGFRCAAPAR